MRLVDTAKPLISGLVFAVAALSAAKQPHIMGGMFGKLELILEKISRSPLHASVVIVTVGLAMHASLSCFVLWPHARISDELSYLLQADTFNHGRLVNPRHAMGRYFESPFVLQEPSYASMYPPGSGLLLAFGQRLGSPVYGAWASVIVAALATYYFLLAVLPPPWALCGCLMFGLHPLMIYWGQNFWGGGVQTAGGALFLGALVRLWRWPSWQQGTMLGIGTALLSISRPFEGFVLAAAGYSMFAGCLWAAGPLIAMRSGLKTALGLIPVIGLMLFFHCVYNKAVTGNLFKMPFMAYQEHSGRYPVFVWQKLGALAEIPYQNVKDVVEFERSTYLRLTASFSSFVREKCSDIIDAFSYLTWYWGLIIPLGFGLMHAQRIPFLRLGLGVLLLVTFAEAMVVYLWPHYLGPIFSLLFCLSFAGLREIRNRYGTAGTSFSRVFASLLVILSVGTAATRSIRTARNVDNLWPERFNQELEHIGGQHLVIVRFPLAQPSISTRPWIGNEADIDSSQVVWAQSLSNNTPLLGYFKNRKVWLLSLDVSNPCLIPYLESNTTR